MANDHGDGGRNQPRRGPQDAFDQRQPANLVQDLRQVRLHPGALAGGQYDYVDITQANLRMLADGWFWLFNQFMAFNNLIDLFGGQTDSFADLACDFTLCRS